MLGGDGSDFEIPDFEEVRKEFGIKDSKKYRKPANAKFSSIMDLLNGFILDWILGNYKQGELPLMQQNIKNIENLIFLSIFPNFKSPPKIKNAIGVAVLAILDNVESSIWGSSNPIKFLIIEKIIPEIPPIIKGFLIIPSNAFLILLSSASLNT